MYAVILAQEFFSSVVPLSAVADTLVIGNDHKGARAELSGDGLAKSIRTFVGPLVMLVVGLAALVFLFKREMTKFFQFAALAVGVAVFFFTPNFLESAGLFFGNMFGGDGADLGLD